MNPLVIAPVAVPLAAAALYAVFGWRRGTAWLGALAAAGLLACAIALAVVGDTGAGPLRADALSAYMLIVIGAVALLAMLAGPAYLAAEQAGHRAMRRYGVLTQMFIAAMALAVLASSLGMLWVAIEATTILTAFLVGHRRTRQATEAAWKYVVICSVGIALALLGIVLLHYAGAHVGVSSLDWAALSQHAARLDPGVTRLAIVLLVLGFGTKAGLAPLHAWLPDAHSQAPAPVSALMSGVLLSVAFYAILRIKVISDGALGVGFARLLLVIVALASLAVAALLLIGQRDYKRMLAYSSIEHMGVVALGAAIGGPLALAAVLLHILGHGLGKSVLFLSSGHLLHASGSSAIDAVRGLAARAPLLAGVFGLGLMALLGLPPFSLFASEVGIARAGLAAGLGWPVAVALLLMLIIVAAVGRHARGMILGERQGEAIAVPPTAATALVAGLAACALLGITTGPLRSLLQAAAAVAGGTP
ncbi:proton-conducting transporter membrane subunit [Nonomuraea basaltis]|uniref:proton-conducting transporter transmembrane domain-containing protein n=1 Tax=Nonomuraea basaltis TaxID=2495887 RepID=UPI00110C6F37|nr:proton-conducting transporter membrane subunit [Nonomuraea basaltis]TMR89877.1 hydrogenase [Nonomuraea basaltis]